VSSFIVNLFSKAKKKSVPLNPLGVASDEATEDDFAPASSSTSSSSSPTAEPPFSASSSLLKPTGRKKATRELRLEKAKRYGMAFMKLATSTAVSHFATGTGGLLNVPGALSTASHIASIKPLLDEPCDNNESDVCKGIVVYVLHQKDRKLTNALIKTVPGIGTAESVMDKGHALDKKIAGGAGDDRFAQARLLVDHAKVCHVALALYAELVYGDLTKSDNFKKALKDVDNDLEWGASEEEPVETAVNKVGARLKPVI
jgi:hypothetical protein